MDPSNHGTFGYAGVTNPNMPHPSNIHSVVLDCRGFTSPNESPETIRSFAEGTIPSVLTEMSIKIVGLAIFLPHKRVPDNPDYFLPQR